MSTAANHQPSQPTTCNHLDPSTFVEVLTADGAYIRSTCRGCGKFLGRKPANPTKGKSGRRAK